MDGVATPTQRTALTDTGWRSPRRLAGLSGLGMLAAILANGPLAAARGVPQYWEPDGATRVGERLQDQASFVPTLAFFFISTLIFAFGIPFWAGLRSVVREHSPDGLGADVV